MTPSSWCSRRSRAGISGSARSARRGPVGELERADVVLLRIRREEGRRLPIDAQRVAREVLGVVVVEPERGRGTKREGAIVLGDEDEAILLHRHGHQALASSGFSFSNVSAWRSTSASASSVSRSFASSMKPATFKKYSGTRALT